LEKDKQKTDLTERRKKREEMQRQREQNELIHPHPNHAKSFTSHHRIGFENKRVVVSENKSRDYDEDKTDMSQYMKKKIASLLEEQDEEEEQEEEEIEVDEEDEEETSPKRVEFGREKNEFIQTLDDDEEDEESPRERLMSKNERLMRICAVAKDLQNKIDETKQVLERIGVEAPLSSPKSKSRVKSSSKKRADSSPQLSQIIDEVEDEEVIAINKY
jgi:hypothetical protein